MIIEFPGSVDVRHVELHSRLRELRRIEARANERIAQLVIERGLVGELAAAREERAAVREALEDLHLALALVST